MIRGIDATARGKGAYDPNRAEHTLGAIRAASRLLGPHLGTGKDYYEQGVPPAWQDWVNETAELIDRETAAPELLGAAEFAAAVLDGYEPPIDGKPLNRFKAGMSQLLSAISKARGEGREGA